MTAGFDSPARGFTLPDATLVRGLLAACGATVGMASGFGTLVLGAVFMTPLGAEFGWTRAEVASCYASATIGMALGGVIWGGISDRVDIRRLLVLGGMFLVLPLLGMAAMSSLWHYHAASFLLGLAGFGCLYAPLLSASGEWFPARRGLVVGIVTAGGAVGQGALPFLAEALIGGIGWRGAFLVIAAMVGAAQLLVLLTVRRPETARGPAGAAVVRARLRLPGHPRLLALSLAAFLCCACMGMPLIHLAGYIGSICGSTALGASSMMIAMAAGAVGRICFGLVADRIGNLPSYMIASAMQSACLVIFPWLQAEASLMILSAVFGFGFAGNMTCLILCIRDEVPAAAFGAAIGPVMFIAWAGMGLGGYLGGALYDLTAGYDAAFVTAALFGAGNLAILGALTASLGPLARAPGASGSASPGA